GAARDQDDGGRTLENGGQHDQPAAGGPFAQHVGAAGAEIRLAAGNGFGDVDVRTAFTDGNVETGVAVEALFKRSVVAGELELVFPFELQGYRFARGCRS